MLRIILHEIQFYLLSFLFTSSTCRRQCSSGPNNDSTRSYYDALNLEQNVPDYFAGTVLLRSSPRYPQSFTGELRFQTLFNIVVIWMAVFIGLSKGKCLEELANIFESYKISHVFFAESLRTIEKFILQVCDRTEKSFTSFSS